MLRTGPVALLVWTLLLVIFSGHMPGQSFTGSISGIVTDSSGASVPAVPIRVTDIERNVDFRAETNETGFFVVAPLPPGKYRVSAEKQGFRPYVLEGLPLSTQQKAAVNITLELGAVADSIKVAAEAQMIEPNTSTLSAVVENKRIMDLPLNGRNVYTLALLVPGVFNERPTTGIGEQWWQGSRFSMNGGRETTNAILLDGVAVDTVFQAAGSSGVTATPSVDSLQEFRIQTNAYSAEFGRSGGGVVTMVSKSGTNDSHGSMFEFLRNSVLDSNGFFANRTGQKLGSFKRNEFGGSFGAPILIPKLYNGRNRTFFFTTFEARRLRSGALSQQTVPSERERAGDFSQTRNAAGQLMVAYDPFTTRANPAQAGRLIRDPLAGNVVPDSRIDPVARKAQAYYPKANSPGLPFTGQLNYVVQSVAPQSVNAGSIKVDHFFNERRRIFFRYNIKDTQADNPAFWGHDNPACAIGCYSQNDRQQNGALDYTHTINSTTLLNLRYGIGRGILDRLPWSFGFRSSTLGLPAYVESVVDMPTFPNITIQDYTELGLAPGIPYKTAGVTHSLVGNLTKVFGRHTLKAGLDGRFNLLNVHQTGGPPPTFGFSRTMTQGPDARTPSAIGGIGYASFLLGAGSSGNMPHNSRLATANKYFGFYVQEDYKVSRKLTVNIGLRWDFETAETERYNRLTLFDPNIQNPMSKQLGMDLRGVLQFPGRDMERRNLTDPYLGAFNPRIGFAYEILPQTIVRAAYGIFFAAPSYVASGTTGSPYNSSTGWVPSLDGATPYRFMSNPFPDGFNFPEGSTRGQAAAFGQNAANVVIEDQIHRPPYNQQWNFTVQRSLHADLVLEVAYAGNKGTHLPFEFPNYVYNQLRPEVMALGDRLLDLVPNPFAPFVQTGTLAQPTVQRAQLLKPFPQYTSVGVPLVGTGNSTYHSLQTRLEKRFSAGASLTAAYTFSKTMADGSDGLWLREFSIRNYYCRTCEKSLSSTDQTHRLVANFTYELPFGKGKSFGGGWNKFADGLLGQWQVNGIMTVSSGLPILLGVSNNTSFSFGGGQHPDSTGRNADLGGERTIDRWFDQAQFVQPAPYTFGNVGRTHPNIRSDRFENVDFSIFKNFRIRERAQFQFRSEAFNIANHPVFAPPNTNLGAPTFGVVTGQQNGPRQIQLALKILF